MDEIYSFRNKNFNSIEGGCAIPQIKKLEIIISCKNFGQLKKGTNDVLIPGLNSKMNELSAIVGMQNLKNIKKLVVNRKKVIKKYINFFKNLEEKNLLENMEVKRNVFCNYFLSNYS